MGHTISYCEIRAANPEFFKSNPTKYGNHMRIDAPKRFEKEQRPGLAAGGSTTITEGRSKVQIGVVGPSLGLGFQDFNDRWVWHFDPKGRFSVKSCYRLIRTQNSRGDGRNMRGDEKMWRWLWQLSMPPKLIFFVWRVLKNALATKRNMFRRNCSPSPSCQLCNAVEETIEHLFFGCHFSARFWERAMPNMSRPNEGTTVLQWFQELMTSSLASQVFTHITVQHVLRSEVHEADRIAKKARDDLLPLDWLSSI
ncbi:Putative ribonuclease H protein At1g65750 [Linum perenne]